MAAGLHFSQLKPDKSLEDFVYGYSSLENFSDLQDGVIIPNGRIDLIFFKTPENDFHVSLIGLETKPKLTPKKSIAVFFAISFNPLGVEYILQKSVANIVDSGLELSNDFWGFSIDDLDDFEAFCKKSSNKIQSLLPKEIDERKRKLFELIFSSNGEMTVGELSEKLVWSPRQINRYFNQQFGVSLKAYCNILRFQTSLKHIKFGKLSPELNFTDQSHFIKEIRKFSGVSPKELFKNENDRFLQFLTTDTE